MLREQELREYLARYGSSADSTDKEISLPKKFTHIGIFFLEEAILDVLFAVMETSPEAPFVRAVDIRRKMGIYEHWDKDGWLVATIVKKLETEGRVKQKARLGPWKLTEAEYERKVLLKRG